MGTAPHFRERLFLAILQLGPAGEELVESGFSLLQLGLGGDERGGIGLDSGIVESGLRGGLAGFGCGDLLLDGGVLASLFVGELFLSGRGGPDACSIPHSPNGGADVGHPLASDGPDASLLAALLVAPFFPLQVIGEGGGIASAIEAEDDGGDAVEQITVVGDQDERALEFEESFFEDLQGGNVEVVGGLVEQEDVGGLEHEARDQDAGALSATEAADRLIELLGGEEKTVSPGGNVNHTVLEDDGVGVRGQGAAQGERRIEFALLLKVDDLEMVGGADGAGVGFELSLQQTQQGGFAAAVGADEADAHSVGDDEIQVR